MKNPENIKVSTREEAINKLKAGIKMKMNKLKADDSLDPLSSSTIASIPSKKSVLENKLQIEPTKVFHGKYEIVQKIGEGANGVVLKCIHKRSNRPYAVKKTSLQVQNINYMKEYFRCMMELDHPSIIRYKSLYISFQERRAFLVQELFQHTDLEQYTLGGQSEVRLISEKILMAIQYLHDSGICHRDIKPGNILYNPIDKQIRLIDFGVSKQVKIGRMYRQMLTCTGTLRYKAPEMFKGFYTELVDEWAAGITIYRLITGVTPFQSEYVSTVIENIENSKVSFEDPVWKKYSPFVKQLIRSLLSPKQHRSTAKQALKHIWFTSHLSSGRVSILKNRGYQPKETMQISMMPNNKLESKFSIEKESSTPNRLSKKLFEERLVSNDSFNLKSVQYDSDEQEQTVNQQIQKKNEK